MDSKGGKNKKQKGGNKRTQGSTKSASDQVKNFHEELVLVRETEDIDTLIELTNCEDETVRLKASQ